MGVTPRHLARGVSQQPGRGGRTALRRPPPRSASSSLLVADRVRDLHPQHRALACGARVSPPAGFLGPVGSPDTSVIVLVTCNGRCKSHQSIYFRVKKKKMAFTSLPPSSQPGTSGWRGRGVGCPDEEMFTAFPPQGMGGQHGYFGLWVDVDFGRGHSKAKPTCTTYNSPQLSAQEDFRFEKMEVWAVGDTSRSQPVSRGAFLHFLGSPFTGWKQLETVYPKFVSRSCCWAEGCQ